MGSEKYEYKLLDSGDLKKLEQFGPYTLIRPASQAIWSPKHPQLWKKADAEFYRDKEGGGQWKTYRKNLPQQWTICLKEQKTIIKLRDLGHVGIFPEHHRNQEEIVKILERSSLKRKPRILNLFAYTGYLSIMLAKQGCEVVHLDASKSSVDWAKANFDLSCVANKHEIRWIVDDVRKFILREHRRKSFYDGIILDPPSFGRGPKGELWKIEKHLQILLKDLQKILKEEYLFFILSSHSQGHTPIALKNIAEPLGLKQSKCFEMTIAETKSNRLLPCGSCFFAY